MSNQNKVEIDRMKDWSLQYNHEALKPVRTTFKLSDNAFKDLKYLSSYFGVTQKEVMENSFGNENVLDVIAGLLVKDDYSRSGNLIRRTKVISKRSLSNLEKIAKKHDIPRNLLVEFAIIFERRYIENQKEKHKEARVIVNELWKTIEECEAKLKTLLGESDPIFNRMGLIYVVAMNLSGAIESEIQDGVPIDPDDMSQSV